MSVFINLRVKLNFCLVLVFVIAIISVNGVIKLLNDLKQQVFVVFQGFTAYEAANFAGYFLNHQNFRLHLTKDDGSKIMHDNASFKFKKTPGKHKRYKTYPV